MLFSSSHVYAYYNDGDSFYYIKHQLRFAILGIIVMVGMSFLNYRVFKKFVWIVYVVTLGLLGLALVMPAKRGEFHRWITLPGGGSFQPSEVAKFAIIALFAYFVAKFGKKMKTFRYGVLPFIITLGIVGGLVFMEHHVSGTVLIVLLGAVMMFIGGTRWRWFVLAFGLIVAGVFALVMMKGGFEYAAARLESWKNPYNDALGDGYQVIQSLIAIGSGGLMGTGIGGSRQKYLYIPEPQNDFIFAVVGEELGFIGAVLILILFGILIWRGLVIALRAKDTFGSMLGIGLTAQVGIQVVLNIAVVTNLLPNTGISLPFFSYGGTALLMLLAQMGIILSISRESKLEKS
ncbi:MAG: cell division protein FtsW [Oscillospiraceae bacterium]|nr:cell division protein FtsW [Oscillospiraceae bacterium]